MTLALRYGVRSDVGLLQESNTDAAYAGPHLLAVADGNGVPAGDMASAATIATIAVLDMNQPASELLSELANTAASANMRLKDMIMSDPAIAGMGTTLTALLWSDGHAATCHIGDSRAYLLRDGQFYQITHDHTLMQSLVDEGVIAEDDAARYPHVSRPLRMLSGLTSPDLDLATHESMVGDRYLLCSGGLFGVVTEQTMHQALSAVRDPDKAALQLVELALKGGGPDNITCIVADVVDTQAIGVPPAQVPVMAGAASAGPPEQLRLAARQKSSAGRSQPLQPLQPGDPKRVGVYRLAGRLGEGGMGQVFLGVSPGGRKVAVKLLHPWHVADPQFRARFRREVAAARQVSGFYAAVVVDADADANPPWLVTAYVAGPSLKTAVTEHGPLSAARVRELGAGLAEGLASIHASGFVHRDLKPANIILADDGPRIIDYGIARALDGANTLTLTGTLIGTFPFMSPEQISGTSVGPESDVFSLGSVLTYAATGHGPFDAPYPAVIQRILMQPPDLRELPRSLRDVITRCLQKKPADRPALGDVLARLAS